MQLHCANMNNSMRKNNIREEQQEQRIEEEEPSVPPLIDVESNGSSGEEQTGLQNSNLPNYNNGEMAHENGKEFGYGLDKGAKDVFNKNRAGSMNENVQSKPLPATGAATSIPSTTADDAPMLEIPKPEPNENASEFVTVRGLLEAGDKLSTISNLVANNIVTNTIVNGCIPSPRPLITFGNGDAASKESAYKPATIGNVPASTSRLNELGRQHEMANLKVEKLNAQKHQLDRSGVAFEVSVPMRSSQKNSNAQSNGTMDANNNVKINHLPCIVVPANRGSKAKTYTRKYRSRSASSQGKNLKQTYHTPSQDAVVNYANIGYYKKAATNQTNKSAKPAGCDQLMRGIEVLPVPQTQRTISIKKLPPQIRSRSRIMDQQEPSFSPTSGISNEFEAAVESSLDNTNSQKISSEQALANVELFNRELSSASFETSSKPNSPSANGQLGMARQKPTYATQTYSQVRDQIDAAKKASKRTNSKKFDIAAGVTAQHVVARKSMPLAAPEQRASGEDMNAHQQMQRAISEVPDDNDDELNFAQVVNEGGQQDYESFTTEQLHQGDHGDHFYYGIPSTSASNADTRAHMQACLLNAAQENATDLRENDSRKKGNGTGAANKGKKKVKAKYATKNVDLLTPPSVQQMRYNRMAMDAMIPNVRM